MGIRTKIEWTDSSINPIMGCSGCALRKEHCYAATLCERHAGRKGWPQSFDRPEFFPGRLEKAIGWKDLTGTGRPDKPWLDGYPRVIFVNDLSDGFCPDVDPDKWLSPLLSQMAASPHIFLLLTKWPDRMASFFSQHSVPDNFWFGTSITNQRDANERIPLLASICASMHFVSLEPLLELVDVNIPIGPRDARYGVPALSKLAWVIAGGETGHGARPMHPQWARDIRNECQAAGVPFFMKQMSKRAPIPDDLMVRQLPRERL